MDVMTLFLGKDNSWEQQSWVSLFFGLIVMSIAFYLDRRKTKDYAFWGYLFGTLTFWVALTSLSVDKGETLFLIYFTILFWLYLLFYSKGKFF
jgi:hypothetical protein